MSLINFSNTKKSSPRASKPLKLILGVGVLAAVIGLGSTLAANIALNTGAPIEFGQGVAQTTSCDNDVTLTPYSTFINSEGAGNFALSSINVSGINSSSGHCAGKEFTIKVYSDSPGTQLDLLTGVSSVTVLDSGTKFYIAATTGLSITVDSNTGFTLFFNSANGPVSADSVYRVTIESRDSSGSIPITYSYGDDGPGGGKIFYVAQTPFSCGVAMNESCTYLEVAPDLWNGGTGDPQMYECYGSLGAVADFGYGEQNTTNVSTDCTYWGEGYTYDLNLNAEPVVMRYSNNGQSDWFIPSYKELVELCKYARYQATGDIGVGCVDTGGLRTGFGIGYNYSSSFPFEGNKYREDLTFSNASTGYHHPFYGTQYIRPIRAF